MFFLLFLSFFPSLLNFSLFAPSTMTEPKKRIFTFVKGESAGASNMKLLVRMRKREKR